MNLLARVGHSLKATLRFPGWGGQHNVTGGTSDWWYWGSDFPGSAYDYTHSVGNLHQNPVVMACVAWMQRAFPEPELQVERREAQTGEWNAVPDHPLPQLFRQPNPYQTEDELWQAVLFDWVLTGNAYLLKRRNALGQVVELWHVPQHRLRPQWDTSGREFVGHYLYQVDGLPQRVPVADVVHFRFGKNPNNERLGWSPLLAGLREVAALNEGANYRGAILRNVGVASHLVSSKDATNPLTPDQGSDLSALWQSRVSGDQRGRPIFSNLPIDITKLGYSPAELDLGTMLNWDADAVCSLIGLSSMVVGISSGSEHRTYANMAEAREMAFEQCLIPTQASFAKILGRQLLPDLGSPERQRVAFDYKNVRILQEDENKLYERLTKAVEKGWMTPNEARAKARLPEMEGGEELRGPAPPAPPGEEDGDGPPESGGDRAAANGRNGRQPVNANS